jgi:hypothetical protein
MGLRLRKGFLVVPMVKIKVFYCLIKSDKYPRHT